MCDTEHQPTTVFQAPNFNLRKLGVFLKKFPLKTIYYEFDGKLAKRQFY